MLPGLTASCMHAAEMHPTQGVLLCVTLAGWFEKADLGLYASDGITPLQIPAFPGGLQ